MGKALPQFVPQDVCLSCDGCCRFKDSSSRWRPKLTREEEQHSLAQKIFAKTEIDPDGYLKTAEERGVCRCQFFNLKDNTCPIYKYRPFECRLYPFILHKKDDKIVVSVHLNCPYIHETRNTPKFQAFAGELRQFFEEPSTKEFVKRNVLDIGSYDEYASELDYLFTVLY